MRLHAFAASLALACFAVPANAALIASGDSNIFGRGGPFDIVPNQRFLLNIAGQNVLLQDIDGGFSNAEHMLNVSAFLTGQGIANTLRPSSAVLTDADFDGRSLFIGFAPQDAYTDGEIAAMQAFLARGGHIILTGDNSNFLDVDARVNAALASLGGGLRLGSTTIDAGFLTANLLTANAITLGTDGFQYAATVEVFGGTPLYGTLTGNRPFLAFVGDLAPGVPEPTSWAMMILGFSAAGAALRHRERRPVTA